MRDGDGGRGEVLEVLSSAALILRLGGWQREEGALSAGGAPLPYAVYVLADPSACSRSLFAAISTAMEQMPWSDLQLPPGDSAALYFALEDRVMDELQRRLGAVLFEWAHGGAVDRRGVLALLDG